MAYADSAILSGAESLLCDVVGGLVADNRFEVDFCAPADNAALVEGLGGATGRSPVADVPSQALPLAAFDLYDPRRITAVRRAVAGLDADVMLLNLPSAEYGATPLLAKARDHFPVVGLMHISGTMGKLGFRLGRVREVLARRAVRRLDSVCLLSEQAKRDYPENWSPDGTRLDVIRMPQPTVEPSPRAAARQNLGLPEDATLIGMAGRLTVKQKGHDTLIDAASILLKERPGLKFVLAGDGQDRDLIEKRLADCGVADSFVMLGQVKGIDGFLNAIDLIAIPSRFEGLPLIALEALAAG
ncbi:MAG: glycosyltransferase, partial [Actinomycetota bacterium]|nr:glycosyltransferase [Actinomycetota bacterium]